VIVVAYLLGRFRDRLAWVGSFSGGKTSKLCTAERERRRDEDRAEPLESVRKSTWVMPVVRTDVATSICWDAAAVDDNSEDHEANDGGDLDDGQGKLD